MEEIKKSPMQFSLMPGLVLGIVLIVVTLIFFLMDVAYDSPITFLAYVVMAGGIFWAMMNYRDKFSGGYLSYGKAFGVGFWVVLFSAILGTIFGYFYVTQINPGLSEEILMNTEIDTIEKYPNISDEDLDRALSFTEMFTTPIMLTIMGFLSNMFFGTIFSLIIAIFVKREDNSLA